MEYDELVNFYKQKLQERYRKCTENPDRRKLMELIQRADGETVSRVTALLEMHDSRNSAGKDTESYYRQKEKDNNPLPKKLTSPTNIGEYQSKWIKTSNDGNKNEQQ